MSQIRIRSLSLLLCVTLLLTLCGCQETKYFYGFWQDLYTLPLDVDPLAYVEWRLFGLTLDELLDELLLREEEYEEQISQGFLYIHDPITVAGKEFTKAAQSEEGYRLVTFLFTPGNRESAKLNGIVYRFECENAEEAAEVAEAIYLATEEEYGTEKHGHITDDDHLCGEGAFDEIRKSKNNVWSEAWCVGDFSYLQMKVQVQEEAGLFTVALEYRILPEEAHRIEPKYKSFYSFGPKLRGEVPGSEHN